MHEAEACSTLKLDNGVLTWLKQARGENLPAGSNLIKEKALKLAKLMHIPDSIDSDDWLDNFKKHHGNTFKIVQGKAVAVDLQSLLDWQQTCSPALIQVVLCRQRLQPGRDWTFLAAASKQDHESQGRTMHWRKEEQAKDYSSGGGKYEWY